MELSIMVSQNDVSVIFQVLARADAQDLPLWLESGWAIDARLGKITRQHGDIDFAFPAERQGEFITLLKSIGCAPIDFNDYGFLLQVRGVLLDCEPCVLRSDSYELEGYPLGSCPWEKQGVILGEKVRCLSWEAMFWEYLYYLEEVPQSQWRETDHSSFSTVCNHLDAATRHALESRFASSETFR
jgi:aminoglycoside 2''-adenylyltransferase